MRKQNLERVNLPLTAELKCEALFLASVPFCTLLTPGRSFHLRTLQEVLLICTLRAMTGLGFLRDSKVQWKEFGL